MERWGGCRRRRRRRDVLDRKFALEKKKCKQIELISSNF